MGESGIQILMMVMVLMLGLVDHYCHGRIICRSLTTVRKSPGDDPYYYPAPAFNPDTWQQDGSLPPPPILAYLLISASSSAATRVDDWVSNWGKDEFTVKASASIGMSFLTFLAFAISSLVSGYNLCNHTSV